MNNMTIEINKNMKGIAQKALQTEMDRIRNATSDSELAINNPSIYSGMDMAKSVNPTLGTLNMKGVLWYKVKSTLIVTGRKNGVVKFKGHGFGLDIGIFKSQIAGSFIVDPETIKEDCYFTLVAADIGEGVVIFALFRSKLGELCGVFAGLTEGLEAGIVAGKGTLKIIGF